MSEPILFPDHIAQIDPQRPAYVMAGSGQTVTYGQMVDESKKIADLLWSAGIKPGATVALLMENNEHFLKIAWAFQRSGVRYVAISHRLTGSEVAYILDDAKVSVLITSDKLVALGQEALDSSESGVTLALTTGESSGAFENLDERLSGQLDRHPQECEGLDLLYSSGTTGRPKGIVAELNYDPLGNAPGFAALFHSKWGIGADSVYLSPAPLYHAAPLRVSMTAMRHGGTVIIMERFDAEAALGLIEQYKVTETQMVPTMLIRMLKLPVEVRAARDLSSLRCVIHAAAPMPQKAKHELIDWIGPIVHEFYSATENYLFTELNSAEWLAHPGSVGKPLSGTPRIVGPDGVDLPAGEVGVIWSEGGLAFEYLNDPDKTANSRNEKGWTTVGDLGYLDEDGYLYLSDRRSDLILSGGVNIYPQEVENVLLEHDDVADAAVFGVPHDELGQVVHAAVQLRPEVDPSSEKEQELLNFLSESVAKFKMPRRIDFADELPRLPTGKLLKRVLVESYRPLA